ncbi:MAG: LytR C-terminal domain-containing protein [Candidatus Latescibacterota bacterium]
MVGTSLSCYWAHTGHKGGLANMREFGRWAFLTVSSVALGCLVGGCKPSVTEEAVSASRVRVEVLNGCGVPGIAQECSRRLRASGFDVVNGDGANAENFDFLETIVVNRCNDLEKAIRVAEALGTGNIIQQLWEAPHPVEEVTVVIGRDFQKLLAP